MVHTPVPPDVYTHYLLRRTAITGSQHKREAYLQSLVLEFEEAPLNSASIFHILLAERRTIPHNGGSD
ncbi:hypothetical protein DL93DRAFT_2086943 [Clavulina sp. PMI_390]|nr:hypothetical protein DL93DRAFT_2086943 [Clavulina sp. PMI_390]